MSDGSSGAEEQSYECLVYDIACEYKHGSKNRAKKLLQNAGHSFSISDIHKELKVRGYLSKTELQDLTSSLVVK